MIRSLSQWIRQVGYSGLVVLLDEAEYDCVEDFTFGRQEESKELMNWLNSNNENVLLLVGEYGTGKTHLLNYAYWRALQEGFAVAYVAMDPNEVPFHKPKRVYSHLIHTFRYYSKESKQNKRFRDFLREAADRHH